MLNREKKLFNEFAQTMDGIYRKLSKDDISKYTTDLWNNYNSSLAKALLPAAPANFLHDREIAGSMFVNVGGAWMETQLKLLDNSFKPEVLKAVLRESRVGQPDIKYKKYNTSHNSIHHLYHIARYEEETGASLLGKKNIIEWGGGYGNLAKIFLRLNPYLCTYTIIDTPLFISLQYAYLASILGVENINLISNKRDKIDEGKINLLPLGYISERELSCDIFISTWALSESSKYAQDYVSQHKFFSARQILLAYQDSCSDLPNASRVENIIKRAGGSIYDISFIRTSQYGFL